MVAIGSKALPLRKLKTSSLTEDGCMDGEDNPYGRRGKKGSMNRKSSKQRPGFDGDHSIGGVPAKNIKDSKISKDQKASFPQTSFVRKQVDPEAAKYYSEIENVIAGTEVDLEERSIVCSNALEESRGKEVELATDYVISHTFQTLLEGCDVDHLCEFLQSCAKDFPCIAMDRSGSHVAETALKSLAMHLQDDKSYSLIEETLTIICQVIVDNPVEMMCNCHGSHVLRSLLCLCKGVPLDSPEFHATKSSSVLAERLNFRPSRLERNDSEYMEQGFPDLLKFLVSGMLNCSRIDVSTLQTDQYSSLVLQTALKLLVGHEEELLRIIPILLGCKMENIVEGNFIEITSVQNLRSLMKETAYSHLMEVILEVAPEALYNELFTKVFRNSLVRMSSHHCGNFVVQALVSHARSKGHMELIWEELGPKFKDLLGMGKPGVIASVIAASQRLHSHEQKCSQALAAAVCSANESSGCIVPRLLFLDSYFSCQDKSNWNWPNGVKIHVMGSLILELVFKFPSAFIQPYITSITSMEAGHVLEASKNSGGQRVIEAFLSSNASGKQKHKLIVKLRGHFGELALYPSGSFTVEKCFNASNVSQREAIVSELLPVQTELSKTKQGPPLLRKLDVDGFAQRPDQWKLRQTSKQSAYKEFYDTFGSKEIKSSKADSFLAETPRTSHPENLKEMRKEIDACLSSSAAPASSMPFLAHDNSTKMRMSGHKRHAERAAQHDEAFTKDAIDYDVLKSKNQRLKKKKKHHGMENAAATGKATDDVVYHQKQSHSVDKKEKKRRRKDDVSTSTLKKLKA
ncbi:pumilio homolog 23 [Actinidia eriantha]|uniref:pumilio homolog 23 n=1 Tax=Actinidia eriantha TaxID=165200 RepID=UPI00259104E4|nr:pumilio homolog 23 [Actinidia eriantha]XP_057505238.1 pumilio homolog 23 [Actinidia eriantha]